MAEILWPKQAPQQPLYEHGFKLENIDIQPSQHTRSMKITFEAGNI
jgi:hypothetical protein